MTKLLTALLLLALTVLSIPTQAQENNSSNLPHSPLLFPPSAKLTYQIKSKMKGLPISGEAYVNWKTTAKEGGTYQIQSETSVSFVGKILQTESTGSIDKWGLAPHRFTEKRIRRDLTTTQFNRATQLISFTSSDKTYPLKGGEQDRLSAMWQLIHLIQKNTSSKNTEKLKPASTWKMFVAGQYDADPWTFTLIEATTIATELGDMNTLHIKKLPPTDAPEQQLDMWLAIDHHYYPVRIQFTDASGNIVDQKITQIQAIN